jgi:flagellar hook-length control protein FliK
MMTDLAAVSRNVSARPAKAAGAAAGGPGGARAESGFAAIMDKAGTPSADVSATADKTAAGKNNLPQLDEAPVSADQNGRTIQIDPLVKQADLADATTAGDVEGALLDAATGKAGNTDTEANVAVDANAAAAAAAAQLAAGPGAVGTASAPMTGKTIGAIDPDKAGRGASRETPLVKQTQEPDLAAATPATATEVKVASAATPARAPEAQPQLNNALAGQPAATFGQAATGGEAGANGSGSGAGKENSRSAAALRAAAEASALPGVDPLKDIVQSLPPGVQAQIGVLSPASSAGTAGPLASTAQLLGDQVIDMSVSGQWIDRMAREIASLSEGTGHSRFQLMPPNLGRIQVDLWQGDDQMNIRLMTETDEAARRLLEGRGALEASARLASLSLGTVSVEKSNAPFDQGRDQNGQNQRQQAEGGNGQQQGTQGSGTQAQGQSGQGRGHGAANENGQSAVIGSEQQADAARATRDGDPRVRFA